MTPFQRQKIHEIIPLRCIFLIFHIAQNDRTSDCDGDDESAGPKYGFQKVNTCGFHREIQWKIK
jgi:hypothetical protein